MRGIDGMISCEVEVTELVVVLFVLCEMGGA